MPSFPDLAGERVAAPAEEFRGFVALAAGACQGCPDECRLEGRERFAEQGLIGLVREARRGPVREARRPVGIDAFGRSAEFPRQVLDRDHGTGRRDRKPAAEIHEFADVAGPFVGDKSFLCCKIELFRRNFELFRCMIEVEVSKFEDVFLTVAEPRHLDAHNIEPMIEVFAEGAFAHGILEILVRRRHDPDVDADRRLTADAKELALGQYAQKASLQRRCHVADLVEEQGAAIGLFEAADAALRGARERAFLVAEEFRLEQLRSERRGIERHERPAAPR